MNAYSLIETNIFHQNEIFNIIVLQNGDYVCQGVYTIKIWRNNVCINTFNTSNSICCLLVLDNNSIAVGYHTGFIKVWRYIYPGHNDSGYIDSEYESLFEFKYPLNDAHSPYPTGSLHNTVIKCLLKLPNNVLVAGSSDHRIKVWQNNEQVDTLLGHNGEVNCLTELSNND